MKRAVSIVLAIVSILTVCTSCQQEEPKIIYKDTLVIDNEEKTLEGVKSRYNAVLNSLLTKVVTLEECHNTSIENSEPDTFYFNSDYIMTSFDPFLLSYFSVTDSFSDDMDSAQAAEVFKNEAHGDDVKYSSENGKATLELMSENLIRIWQTEYDERTDSFRYSLEDLSICKSLPCFV